jgi:soluble lytic murein transglycosylase-like protein
MPKPARISPPRPIASRRRPLPVALLLAASVFLGPNPAAAQSPTPASADEPGAQKRETAAALGSEAGPAEPMRATEARTRYRALIAKETAQAGLPREIADAVMAVESGYDPDAIGASGEIGLMQVMPPTARMLGFAGDPSDLAAPEVNIHYGVTYLAQAWRLAGGDLCTTVMKYRAGHGETRFSYRSVDYCLAVRSQLAARGYPVTGPVPIATFGEASPPFSRLALGRASSAARSCRSRCLTALGGGRPNLEEINNSLSQLVLQANVRAVRLR